MKELYILPFDHRGSFMKDILKAHSPPTDDEVAKARSYKQIIYDAFKKSLLDGVPKASAGILVDEWLGKEILLDAHAQGFITCTPLEKSGQEEFDFDREDWKEQLAELKPTYAKVLVRYNPEGNKEMNVRQAERLVMLSEYLKGQPTGYLFELLVPGTQAQLEKAGSAEVYEQQVRPALMVQAIKEMQEAGVNPDVWKLEGLDSTALMQKVADQVVAANPDAGIIILGRGESAEKAEHWLRMGAKVDAAIGFAVGRTIFRSALQEHEAGSLTREQAVGKIAGNYKFFVDVWRKVKSE
jgi:myo-inositol catabolism protein IolC